MLGSGWGGHLGTLGRREKGDRHKEEGKGRDGKEYG